MAKINFTLGEIKGRVGGVVFQGGPAGSIIRLGSTPVNPFTPAQSLQREAFGFLSKQWGGSLSEAQRGAWDSLASTSVLRDSFGNPIGRTGYMLFMELNSNRRKAGYALLSDAPANLDVVSLNNPQIGENLIDDAWIEVVLSSPLVANQKVWVEGAVAQGAAVTSVRSKLNFWGVGVDEGLQGYSVVVPTRFGFSRSGRQDWLLVRGFNELTGTLSPGTLLHGFPS